MSKPYKICLVGCGVAGSLLLLKLLETVDPSEICVIDPAFDGGALARQWSEVLSNSPWGNFLEFGGKLTLLKPFLDKKQDKYAPEAVLPVGEFSHTLRQALAPHLLKIDANTCYVKSVNYDSATALWQIQMDSPGCSGLRHAQTIVYSPGGIPKQVNLSKRQIPLEVSLDPMRLSRYVEPGQRILLFGLSHSGTLALKNLLALGVQVSAIYRTPTPFQFQRDGIFCGIKQTAAQFADELLATPNDLATLIPAMDAEATIRAYNKCDAIISAIGFVKNTKSMEASLDGQPLDLVAYDSQTGAIGAAPHAFGFGMAYPSLAPFEGKLYEEAGIEAFVNHLEALVPAILSSGGQVSPP